jgi:lysophospholipase L1-like esterase
VSWRAWLGRLTLLVGGSITGLLLAELALRLAAPAGAAWLVANSPALYDTNIFYVDSQRRLLLKPDSVGTFQTPEFHTTVRINALGLRGPELSDEPALRVLTVGDSYTLGVQVDEEETFQALLARSLTASLGRRVEVLNGGVDSHGTYDAIGQIERVSAEVSLDAVVLTFFVGNDLYDDCNRHRRRLRPGPLRPPPPQPLLRRVSHLYTWASVWLSSRQMASDPMQGQRFREELSLFTAAADLDAASRCSVEALSKLSHILSERDLPGIVGIAPPAFAVHPERLPATFALVGLDPAAATLGAPAATIAAKLPTTLTSVSLSDPLEAAASDAAMFFTFDGHWTAAGHAVVAEAYAGPIESVLR